MPLSTQPYKGSRDFFPEDQRIQRWIFDRLTSVAKGFGYLEYNGPMLEPFDLYAAKTGEEVVNQQLYSFDDRGGRKVAMRPEMTPTLARMVASRVQELPKPIRWFSIPNLWRYERPQKGRLREHWQLNVDLLGGDSLLADVEILEIVLAIFADLGGEDKVKIKVNNRRLMDNFFYEVLGLEPKAGHALAKLIDAKDKLPAEKFADGLKEIGIQDPARVDAFLNLDLESLQKEYPSPGVDEVVHLFRLLGDSGVKADAVEFDASIMRGMDYYTGTVFEAFDLSPDNNRALCGGGRYDNLIGLFGKQQLSGMGFGLGDVTLRNFIEAHGLMKPFEHDIDVLITTPTDAHFGPAKQIAGALRAQGLSVVLPLSFDGFGAQLKRAAKLQARWVLLLGDEELKKRAVGVKDLKTGHQTEVQIEGLGEYLLKLQRA